MVDMIEFLPTPTEEIDLPCRILTPEEVRTLEPLFHAQGQPLPPADKSVIVGSVKGGKVVAFLVLQQKLHAEPMYVEPGYSHLVKGLVKAAEDVIITQAGPTWVYLFAPAGRVAQLAQAMGMQQEPYVIMCKLVAPERPPMGEFVPPPAEVQPPPVVAEPSLTEPVEDYEDSEVA